jgi:hypothetical protein
MPAPAHVDAYAQGGLLFAAFVLTIVGMAIAAVAHLRTAAGRSGIHHALYIQGLVMLYYLTQVSLRGVLWDSYGIYWSAVTLAALAILSRLARPRFLGGWNLRS